MVAVQAAMTTPALLDSSLGEPQSAGFSQQYVMTMLVPVDHFGNFGFASGANEHGLSFPPACAAAAGAGQAQWSTKPEDLLAAKAAADAAAGLEACLAQYAWPMAPYVPTQSFPVQFTAAPTFTATSSATSGDSDSGSREELGTRLTASAARRLRRRRAAERSQMDGEDALTAARYEELQLKVEAGQCETLCGHVWAMAHDLQGCRLVQLALEKAELCDAIMLTEELQGHVLEAAISPHANYVLQKMIMQLPTSATGFIAEEIMASKESASKIARNRHGCRILCRLLEFSSSESKTSALLVSQVLEEAEDLCRHSFGHHVLQAALEHGNSSHRSRIAAALLSDLDSCAKHRNGSYLVEKALKFCCEEDQRALLERLVVPSMLEDLALNQYGSFVAKAVLSQLEEM